MLLFEERGKPEGAEKTANNKENKEIKLQFS